PSGAKASATGSYISSIIPVQCRPPVTDSSAHHGPVATASLPGSLSTPSRHLCGFSLVDALYLVCGQRGFYVNRSKRNLEALLAKADPFKEKVISKRGIVEHCCHMPHPIHHLENYTAVETCTNAIWFTNKLLYLQKTALYCILKQAFIE
ncbi:putative preproinsulin b, partial [Triplophysa rosa]